MRQPGSSGIADVGARGFHAGLAADAVEQRRDTPGRPWATSDSPPAGSCIDAVTTPSALTPVGACSIRETLRTRSADAISTAQASATSVTTSRRFQRRPRTPVDVRRAVFQRLGRLRPREDQRRQQPEEDRRARRRSASAIAEQPQIDRGLREARHFDGHRGDAELQERQRAERARRRCRRARAAGSRRASGGAGGRATRRARPGPRSPAPAPWRARAAGSRR